MVELVRQDPDIITVKSKKPSKRFHQEGDHGFTEGEQAKKLTEYTTEELLAELGLPHNATYQEVKKRYHRLILTQHTDKGGSTEDFVRISAIYEILGRMLQERYINQEKPLFHNFLKINL